MHSTLEKREHVEAAERGCTQFKPRRNAVAPLQVARLRNGLDDSEAFSLQAIVEPSEAPLPDFQIWMDLPLSNRLFTLKNDKSVNILR